MATKERIGRLLAEHPEALDADELARGLVDQDVAAGEYEGCSSELESWYMEYLAVAQEVLSARAAVAAGGQS